MPSEAQDLISEFSEPITIVRYAPNTQVGGRWVDGPTTQIVSEGSLQPLLAQDLLTLTEGQRQKSSYRLFTATQLFLGNSDTRTKSDRIQVRGQTYEVQRLESWGYDFVFWVAVIVGVNT